MNFLVSIAERTSYKSSVEDDELYFYVLARAGVAAGGWILVAESRLLFSASCCQLAKIPRVRVRNHWSQSKQTDLQMLVFISFGVGSNPREKNFSMTIIGKGVSD